ncbi:hypothetical protein D3C85_274630 [compost metagenome]
MDTIEFKEGSLIEIGFGPPDNITWVTVGEVARSKKNQRKKRIIKKRMAKLRDEK